MKHRCIAAIAALFTRHGRFHRPQTPKSRANGDDHRKLLAGLGLKPRPDITDAGDCPDCQRTADSAVDWLQDRTEFYYGPDGPPRRDG
ncbi:MAG TPA: hypothetical protein VFN09_06150 [Rhodanobacteraceae bacterium]|nr:hypothetical protein [Rhodanobacteraceae bacterium]